MKKINIIFIGIYLLFLTIALIYAISEPLRYGFEAINPAELMNGAWMVFLLLTPVFIHNKNKNNAPSVSHKIFLVTSSITVLVALLMIGFALTCNGEESLSLFFIGIPLFALWILNIIVGAVSVHKGSVKTKIVE